MTIQTVVTSVVTLEVKNPARITLITLSNQSMATACSESDNRK
ncbi:hypothetical protein [Brevibacillus reuszeri]|nr:hypothetical protein [Brevibacillus reuszeri]